MRVRPFVLTALAATLILISACQTPADRVEKLVQARISQADSAKSQMSHAEPPPTIIHDQHDLLGVREFGGHGDRLPARCEKTVVLRSARPLTLGEIAERLSQILQVPVQSDQRGGREREESGGKAGRDNPPSFPVGEAPTMKVPPGFAVPISALVFQPDLSGSCKDLLDRIAGQFDVEWRMRGGVLWFDRQLVRTFPIKASAATAQISSTMSSGGNNAASPNGAAPGGAAPTGGSGSSNGGSSQSASVSVNNDIWAEVESGLKTILASNGRYSLSRASGTVTIVAPPRAMSDAEEYIQNINNVISATIAVEVSAIYITVDDADNYGLDLNLLYQVGARSLGLNGLVPTIAQSPGTGSVAILSPPSGANNFSTHFAGSQVFLNAVSSANRLADYRSATVTGRNGVAMPITLSTNQDIVRSLQFAVGLQSGAASTSASTSTINYGFSLQVLPRVTLAEAELDEGGER
jgi:hypothetical protein